MTLVAIALHEAEKLKRLLSGQLTWIVRVDPTRIDMSLEPFPGY